MPDMIIKSLGDVTAYMAKGIPPKYADRPTEDTVIVLNQKCNRQYKISLEHSRLHDTAKKAVPADKLLQNYDVLINSTGTGTAGRVAQINFVEQTMTVDGHMIILRCSKEIDPLYYGYAVKAHQPEIELLAEGSTGQTEINRRRLEEEIMISYPKNIEDQKKISSLLFEIDEKISINQMVNKNLAA